MSLDDKCVRCGACLAVCPVYKAVLKERFSPRGKNFLLRKSGIDRKNPLFIETIRACLQCGACTAACSSGSDVCSLIREERRRHGYFRTLPRPVYSILSSRTLSNLLVMAAGINPVRAGNRHCTPGSRGGIIGNLLEAGKILRPAGTAFLSAPEDWTERARKCLKGRVGQRSIPQTALFVGCAQDFLFPGIPGKIAALAGRHVIIPGSQACCGLPAFCAGAVDQARKAVRRNLGAFKGEDFQVLLTGCASCASMIKKWPGLFEPGTEERIEAEELSEKVMEFSGFALEFLNLPAALPEGGVVFQMPCHQRYDLGRASDPVKLLSENLGERFMEADLGCCGQGGIFGFSMPDISGKILESILSGLPPGVDYVATTCSGCLIRLKTGLASEKDHGSRVQACHIVDILFPDREHT